MAGHSLHIGLNNVDPAAYDGWDGALSGCHNDAQAMTRLAQSQGFTATTLLDSHATSRELVAQLHRLSLLCVPDDICLVTYSGHGGQVPDINGDDEDANDETWVLWDRQVVDDELFQMWSQFASGVRIVVISDSCHSGTVARRIVCSGCGGALGGSKTAEGATVVARRTRDMPPAVQAADVQARRGTYDFVQALAGARSGVDLAAQLILISGCQDNQLSYDGDLNGQFTGALLAVWSDGAFSGDYSDLHRRILDRMPSDQSPNLLTLGDVTGFLQQRPFSVQPPVTGGPVIQSQTRPMLSLGSSGPDVVYLQQRLNAHGATLVADGWFGQVTEVAVRGFQASHSLSADGIVGAATWAALETASVVTSPAVNTPGTASTNGTIPDATAGSNPGTPGTVATAARPTIRRGDDGPHVTYLQELLSRHGYASTVDGIFGLRTESSVRSFQYANDLQADGVVGPGTWLALG